MYLKADKGVLHQALLGPLSFYDSEDKAARSLRGLLAPVKVDVCHQVGNGEYKLISKNEDKVDCGDSYPGDDVPDMAGYIFD